MGLNFILGMDAYRANLQACGFLNEPDGILLIFFFLYCK